MASAAVGGRWRFDLHVGRLAREGPAAAEARLQTLPSRWSERANVQLKTWHILRKLRCCPWRAGQLAIHVLQIGEIVG